MPKDNILVSITASREKNEIVYSLDCSSTLTNEELEYYLEEIIKGILQMETRFMQKQCENPQGNNKNKEQIEMTSFLIG